MTVIGRMPGGFLLVEEAVLGPASYLTATPPTIVFDDLSQNVEQVLSLEAQGDERGLRRSTLVGRTLTFRVQDEQLSNRLVILTNAQMLAVRATPITLVAAPGANRAIIVERVVAVSDATAGVWSETVDNLAVEYSGGLDILTLETTGFIDQAGVEVRSQAPAEAVLVPPANEAVQIFNSGDGEIGGGNVANTFGVRVFFRTVDTVSAVLGADEVPDGTDLSAITYRATAYGR